MNLVFKERVNHFAQFITVFGNQLLKTISSVLRLVVLSRPRAAKAMRDYKELKSSTNCCILGNGPSLANDFATGHVLTEGNDLFCVNMFCSSPLFWELKPKFYFLVDVAFFAPTNERQHGQVKELIAAFESVNWEMFLVVSSSSPQNGELFRSLHNKHIKVLKMNTTTVEGFKGFRLWAFRSGCGMPRCQTVVNFAICAGINMRYENVFLYGADHTWTRDLFVDEDNVVCYGDRHVYNKSLTIIKKEYSFAHLLEQFAKMFQSHYMLEEYSRSVGVKIWNCSSDSFLDAYERRK